MQTEIEAKFLNINHDLIRDKLKSLGAICEQELRLMRRKNFDFPDLRLERTNNGWVRVRDEGSKVTLAYKQLNDRTLHGTKEISVTVSNFDDTCKFLEAIGLKPKSYQETKRESWRLDGAEIELDEWPWIKPYIEVEAKDESSLKSVVKQLGLDIDNAKHGSVEVAYIAEYDVTEDEIDRWQEILFVQVPDWLESKRR